MTHPLKQRSGAEWLLHVGDAIEGLRALPDGIAQTCITSPPYFGLRDYGHDGQIGLEQTPAEFIAKLVAVFNQVRRVLAEDGTLWLNMGDSYAGSWGAQGRPNGSGQMADRAVSQARSIGAHPNFEGCTGTRGRELGLKAKDLMGMPWRLAFALQDAGWYLRQDIIWHKPNPMPESVRDRCTKAHEYLFLLSKSPRYYFDAEAIAEPVSGTAHRRSAMKTPDGWDTSVGEGGHGLFHKQGREKGRPPGVGPKASKPGSGVRYNESFAEAVSDLVDVRNKRSVWTVATKAFSEAHFATFPPDLIVPCVMAGAPPGGLVLDPFTGSGTTGMVALEQGRRFYGCELNPEYAEMARRRIEDGGRQGRLVL